MGYRQRLRFVLQTAHIPAEADTKLGSRTSPAEVSVQ